MKLAIASILFMVVAGIYSAPHHIGISKKIGRVADDNGKKNLNFKLKLF